MVPRDMLRSVKRTLEETRAGVARRSPSTQQLGAGACLVLAVLLVLAWGPALAVLGSGTVGASHYDEDNIDTGGENNATIFTYGDESAREQRQPGASEIGYWNQNVIQFIEEDGERAYLNQTMVWRPVVSACEVSDLDNLGVDRGSTYQDERQTDEEKIDSLEDSFDHKDVRDRWESEWEGAGDDRGHWDLVGPDTEWDYVELVIVDWRTPSEFPTGPYFGLENGDRAVAAQDNCFTNPNEPGWYRWAWTSDYEFEDGSMSESDAPSFSHWYYICDCESEQEAREKLGPPPSERDDGADEGGDGAEETATPDEAGDDGEGPPPDESGDDGEETTATEEQSDDGSTDDDGTGDDGSTDDDGTGDDGTTDDGTGDDGTTDDGTGDDGTTDDGTGEDDDSTPGTDDTPGFGPGVAVIAFVAITLLAWYRS